LRRLLGTEYELLAPIGEGGFARVYKAKDLRLDRIVAIKVIRPDMAGAAAFVESFRHEGIALAKLRHPGIVPIYDIRESEGLIYYVMPLVEGDTLSEKLKRLNRLPPSETQRILTELCDALGAAHRAKMVHRDVKPANVILEGHLEKALLMDFGIAKALTDEVQESSAEPVVGTPQYMSPEQIAGWDEIDHRSDIYSLGVMAYRMLTGKLPFDGETPQEILEKHIKEKPVPIRQVNTSVPKNFADAIMRCLEKDPWDRFSTTMELWSELQNVSFFPTNTEIRPSSPPPGTPIKVVASIAAIGLIAGFMTGRVVYRSDPVPPPPSNSAAETLVSGWLETMDGSDTSAFEPRAIVMHMAIDSESSSPQVSPRRLPEYGAITNRLASMADRPLKVLRFGNVAIVSGSYGTREPACGTAWFTLRSRGEAWRIMHLRLQDVEATCKVENNR
jgi:serine/threonine protein kinase